MHSRDWYLTELGITQYVLRKSAVFKGEIVNNIADNIKLIVVASAVPTEKIFTDILKAIHLETNQCLHLTQEKLIMPIEQLQHVIWFIDQPLPESWELSPIKPNKAIIESISLDELAKSPQLKRQLWQTLCRYENNFNA